MRSIARFVGRVGTVAVLGLVMATGAGVVWADSKSKGKDHDRDDHDKDCDRDKQEQVVVVNGDDQAIPVRVVGGNTGGGGTPEAAPPFQPFQHPFGLDWPDGEGLVFSNFAVPAGKRLVIEYASLFAYLPDAQTMFVRIFTSAGGAGVVHNLAVQRQEDYGVLKQFGAAHLVKLYADPGTTVQVQAGRLGSTGTANCTVTLSGHFEDVP
jgi:hypothetical protein